MFMFIITALFLEYFEIEHSLKMRKQTKFILLKFYNFNSNPPKNSVANFGKSRRTIKVLKNLKIT